MEASPLRKLPAELRNNIYQLAFTRELSTFHNDELKPQPINILFCIGRDGQPRPLTSSRDRHAAALTATCREVRNDTIGMFYSISRFSLNLARSPSSASCTCRPRFWEAEKQVALLKQWLDKIGAANTTLVRDVCLLISVCDHLCDLGREWSRLRTLIGGIDIPVDTVHVEFKYFTLAMCSPYTICHRIPLWDTEAARRVVDWEVAQMKTQMKALNTLPKTYRS